MNLVIVSEHVVNLDGMDDEAIEDTIECEVERRDDIIVYFVENDGKVVRFEDFVNVKEYFDLSGMLPHDQRDFLVDFLMSNGEMPEIGQIVEAWRTISKYKKLIKNLLGVEATADQLMDAAAFIDTEIMAFLP